MSARPASSSKSRFYEAVIISHARLTYDQAWSYLQNPKKHAGDVAAAVGTSLQTLYAVYGALKSARDARGALDFRGGEVKARIGEKGTIEGFYAVMRNDAHRLIEECMIAANVEAAVALRLRSRRACTACTASPRISASPSCRRC